MMGGPYWNSTHLTLPIPSVFSRRSIVPSAHSGMPLWQDKIFIFLMKNAANPTDFYKIPPGRVVELGTQVTV